MNVTISNTIRIQNPDAWIQKWCLDNLILPNPEFAKKQRLGLWLGKTPRTIHLFEIQGDTWVLPYGVLTQLPVLRHDAEYDFKDAVSVDYGKPVPLYDYQLEAVRQMMVAQYGILQSAAGSGKTQMGIAMIKEWGKCALWICHTADLLKQSRDRALQYMDKSLTGTITEGKVQLGTGVTFATVQTMCHLDLTQYRDYWDVIIVDECHRAAGSPTSTTMYYKVLSNLAARHKYGLSATPDRSDGLIKATYALLGGVRYTVPDEAVESRIMKVSVHPVFTGVTDTDQCYNPDGTLNYSGMISALCNNDHRTELIVKQIIENCDHFNLVLSDRLDHLESMLTMLPEELFNQAIMIHGKTPKRIRDSALEHMRTGEKRFLFATYALAKEGLDVPRLDRLFLTTPVKYHATVIQSLGRIARVCEGKQDPIAYDFVDDRIRYCVGAYKERCKHYRKAGVNIEQ